MLWDDALGITESDEQSLCAMLDQFGYELQSFPGQASADRSPDRDQNCTTPTAVATAIATQIAPAPRQAHNPTMGQRAEACSDGRARPHACPDPGCSYAAMRASHLRTHMMGHQGGKGHKCEFPSCAYKTNRKEHLTRHVKRVHDMLPAKREPPKAPAGSSASADSLCRQAQARPPGMSVEKCHSVIEAPANEGLSNRCGGDDDDSYSSDYDEMSSDEWDRELSSPTATQQSGPPPRGRQPDSLTVDVRDAQRFGCTLSTEINLLGPQTFGRTLSGEFNAHAQTFGRTLSTDINLLGTRLPSMEGDELEEVGFGDSELSTASASRPPLMSSSHEMWSDSYDSDDSSVFSGSDLEDYTAAVKAEERSSGSEMEDSEHDSPRDGSGRPGASSYGGFRHGHGKVIFAPSPYISLVILHTRQTRGGGGGGGGKKRN
jgi:hypothetical protein